MFKDIVSMILKELGRVHLDSAIEQQCPTLVKLFDPKRRLIQDGPMAQFEGGFETEWENDAETYTVRDDDLLAIGTARGIVDHLQKLRYDAASKLAAKIEAKSACRNYDLERCRGISLAGWWMREAAERKPGSKNTVVYLDCVFAFGPWTPPEADEPAIAGKVGA